MEKLNPEEEKEKEEKENYRELVEGLKQILGVGIPCQIVYIIIHNPNEKCSVWSYGKRLRFTSSEMEKERDAIVGKLFELSLTHRILNIEVNIYGSLDITIVPSSDYTTNITDVVIDLIADFISKEK